MKFRFKVLNEDIQPNKLEAVLGSLTPTQIAYIKEYWNAFYNDPEKYSIYADMIKETMAEKGIK